jgi:biopolymer transport protein ExbD
MKLRNFRTFLVFFFTLLFITEFSYWNIHEQKTSYSFQVRISLNRKENESDEEFYWRSQKSLFPKIEIPNPKILPNDDSFLIVSVGNNEKLKLNSETQKDIESLKDRLKEIFRSREEYGVFEPNSNKIVKTVVIKSSLSTKYGDVVKVIDAVKESGAEPIILQIDDLPN